MYSKTITFFSLQCNLADFLVFWLFIAISILAIVSIIYCSIRLAKLNKQIKRKDKPSFKEVFRQNLKNLFGKKPNTKKDVAIKTTVRITYTALLTALATVFNIVTFYPVKYFSLSFTAIPCFIAGIMLGPISGFTVGFLGDFIGFLIAPPGPYMPMVGIASGLMGFIPGMVFLLFKFHPHLKIFISYILCLIICTAGLNTLNIWLVYSAGKTTFLSYLSLRLPFQVAVTVINMVLTILLYICLVKVKVIKKVTYKKAVGKA